MDNNKTKNKKTSFGAKHLLFFYGKDCEYCKLMEGLVKDLKKEGIELKHLEVWENKDNEKLMINLDKKCCGGVPFFINTQTGKTICGEESYEKLKNWAEGK